ncbi:feruloyl esterase-like protein [Pseudohyphozyma bogoriensis]|nr:feruloyl esterase-like protein [Pseudohyphozyma bogoriensis]
MPTRHLLPIFLAASVVFGWSDKCADFKLPESAQYTASLTDAVYYAAGEEVNITDPNGGGIITNQLPAFCRLILDVPLPGNVTAVSEVWLPDSWTSRVLAVGNGGFAGNINRGDLGFQAVDLGFVGVGTDTGHVGTAYTLGPLLDPETLLAFTSGSALVTSSQVAFDIAEAYYGSAVGTKIYSGCSTGGGQAMNILEKHPDVFDGVIGGDPDYWHSHTVSGQIQFQQYFAENTSSYMTAYQWELLGNEVLKQFLDGVINDPRICPFRPETILCTYGQNKSECLNPDQVTSVKKLYSTWTDINSTYIFGGYFPGSESGLGPEVSADNLGSFGAIQMAGLYTNNTDWVLADWNTSAPLLDLLVDSNPGGWDNANPNITAFISQGKKFLHYHGFSDPLISPVSSIEWFETLHSFFKTYTTLDLAASYKFLPIPGMDHCAGGRGAVSFGGQGQASSGYPAPKDAQHQITLAMAEWIEKGVEPALITTKWATSETTEVQASELTVNFTRPLCAFPAFAHYVGSGADENKAESFECY